MPADRLGLYVHRPALLRLEGPDASHFLDNLLTRNVSDLAPGAVGYAGLLTPQGKVAFDMLIWRARDGSAYLIETAAERGPHLLARLKLYRLRAKVQIEDVSAQLTAAAVFDETGPGAGLFAPDPRRPDFCRRAILEVDAMEDLPAATYHARRIEAGIPDLAHDAAPEELFALEALFEELNGVDFHKGCFVGQENVSRMKRRATTRRKLCRVRFDGPAPAYGAPITAGAAALGDVRSSADGVAMAFLRLDRAREALDKGEPLMVAGQPIRLDPPDWLIQPMPQDGESA